MRIVHTNVECKGLKEKYVSETDQCSSPSVKRRYDSMKLTAFEG